MVERTRRRIPDATVARLPVYLRILYELAAESVSNVSSERLAELAGVNAAKVRKDLSYLGSYGTRGVGDEVDYLTFQMRRGLGGPPPLAKGGRGGGAPAGRRGRHRRRRHPGRAPRQLRRLRRAGLPG